MILLDTNVTSGASIATRNVDDFTDLGLTILNPWDG
jgi:hypothetical protein